MCPMEDFAEQPRRRGRPKKQQFASEAIQEEPGQPEHTPTSENAVQAHTVLSDEQLAYTLE